MNIFETIGKATSRNERFHSQFLADALCESLSGDRSLFNQVWKLVTPPEWEIPKSSDQVKVIPEQRLEEGRIDICIQSFLPQHRVIGMEIKTVEESVESGQLERYRAGLKTQFQDFAIQVAYITPFNREHAGVWGDSLPSVMEFERFQQSNSNARHVSWLDLESIPWDDNPVWKQHQAYVREHISSQDKLRASVEKNRGIAFFFGAAPARMFWDELSNLEISGEGKWAILDLAAQRDAPSVADSLVKAFEILVRGNNVVDRERNDKFADKLRQRFLKSGCGEVHAAPVRTCPTIRPRLGGRPE